jgi:hypothetical protein
MIAGGECIFLKPGLTVYIEDTAIFKGMIKIRLAGSRASVWTAIEAVEWGTSAIKSSDRHEHCIHPPRRRAMLGVDTTRTSLHSSSRQGMTLLAPSMSVVLHRPIPGRVT